MFVAGLVWITLLPSRQATFRIEEHELRVSGSEIVGRVANRGPAVPALRLEAYLYDAENRYLGTARVAVRDVPAEATLPFRVPLDPGLAGRVARYSLYAGTAPNPFAPDR